MTDSGTAPGSGTAPPVAVFAALADETRWAVLETLAGADSVGADPVGADPAGADSVRADSVRADSVRADSARARSVGDGASGDARAGLTASALAARLPVTRQAIAKHLAVLEAAGLVESQTVGRERRYRALGAELTALGRRLERIGDAWEARLGRIASIAEDLERD